MAKSQRSLYPTLPLSPAFYDALARVGQRFGLDLRERARMSEAVAALSHTYNRERDGLAVGALGESAPLARLGFYLPRDMIKMFGPLAELAREGRHWERPSLRVLDLGAGLGASGLGLARFLRYQASPVARIALTAYERDALSTKLLRATFDAVAALPDEFTPVELDAHCADLSRGIAAASGPFDLVLLGFVLNELYLERPAAERCAARAELLSALGSKLSPEGAIVVLEPALRESARELMRVRDLLSASGELSVFAPCVHRAPCPMLTSERDWCHESLDFALPEPLAEVARGAGLRFEGLRYAALVLTRAPRFAPEPKRLRIVSERLESKGKLEYFGCGSAGYQRLTRLDRHRSPANAAFDQLRRGDIVELDGARIGPDSALRKR